MKTIGLTRRN